MNRSVPIERRLAAIVGAATAGCLGAGVLAAAHFERASTLNQKSVAAASQVAASVQDDTRRAKFTPANGEIDPELPVTPTAAATAPVEALAAFDGVTNGFDPQGPSFGTLNEATVVPLRS